MKGVAIDLGTTTVAAALVDVAEAGVLKEASIENPQSRWGADVVSRMEAIIREPRLLNEMRSAVVGALNGVVRELAGASLADIAEVTVAGNTVMEHIFAGVSPVGLARPPHRPEFRDARRLDARESGLSAGAGVYIFPIINGFVGGDAVAAALSIGAPKSIKTTLIIDVGTNSEILLSSKGVLYAASAAAGPAFEAGGIRHGMRASSGAVRAVDISSGDVALDVVGGVKPKGICGTGLIDAAARLLEAGIIEPSGRIRDRSEVSTNLANRIQAAKAGNAFVLYKAADREITLGQDDVRSLQTAKAAIKAGISVLLKRARITEHDVDAVCIAGAFGSSMAPESLKTIGLLTPGWVRKVSIAGDAALAGAALALSSDEKKAEAEEIAKNATYVSLSGSANFEREFIRSMDFA